MALINCPECGKEVSDSAKQCPHCGFSVQDYINRQIQIEKIKEDSAKEAYDYVKNEMLLRERLKNKKKERKRDSYEKAIELFQSSSSSVKEAKKIFAELGDYLEASTYLEQCEAQFKKLKIEEQEKKKKFSFRIKIVVCVLVFFILSLIAISYLHDEQRISNEQSISDEILATFDDDPEFISYSLGKDAIVNLPSTWTYVAPMAVKYHKYSSEHIYDVRCTFTGTKTTSFYNVVLKVNETQVDYSSRTLKFNDIHIKNADEEYFLQIKNAQRGTILTRIVFSSNGDTHILDVNTTTEAYSDDLITAIVNNIIIQ